MRRAIPSLFLCILVELFPSLPLGCMEPLAPVFVLDGPRILAIRAEPPALVPAKTVTLDALVYVPTGLPTPEYEWSWCASLGSTQQCSTTADELAALLTEAATSADENDTEPVTVSYAIGTDSSESLAYPISPTLAQAVCDAALPGAGGNGGEGGAGGDSGDDGPRLVCRRDTWTTYILLTVTVGEQKLLATRELAAYFEAPATLNENPSVLGLEPFIEELPALEAEDEYATADGAIGAYVDGALTIGAAVPESASELIEDTSPPDAPPDSNGGAPPVDEPSPDDSDDEEDPSEMHEVLSLAWYVESGTFEAATTTLPLADEGTERDWSALLLNQWSPKQNGPVEFILVIRDDRGGIGWLRQPTSWRR